MSESKAEIREAAAADLVALERLERDAFRAPWSEADLAPFVEREGALALVAESPSGPIAYALFLRVAGEAELLRIGVAGALRGRGVAADLLAEGLRRLALAGDRACHLEVREGNAPARRLYLRAGFEIVGRRRGYYDDGEDAILYRRALAEAPHRFG